MRGIPNMQVFCPADQAELVAMLPAILQSPDPAYLRYNASKPVVEHAPFAVGQAETFGEGTDVALLTFGFLLEHVKRAAELLEARGVGVRLVNLRTLKPIDERAVVRAARDATLLAQRLTAKTLPIALEERWFCPATLPRVLEHEGFTGEKLAARVFWALEEQARR